MDTFDKRIYRIFLFIIFFSEMKFPVLKFTCYIFFYFSLFMSKAKQFAETSFLNIVEKKLSYLKTKKSTKIVSIFSSLILPEKVCANTPTHAHRSPCIPKCRQVAMIKPTRRVHTACANSGRMRRN